MRVGDEGSRGVRVIGGEVAPALDADAGGGVLDGRCVTTLDSNLEVTYECSVAVRIFSRSLSVMAPLPPSRRSASDLVSWSIVSSTYRVMMFNVLYIGMPATGAVREEITDAQVPARGAGPRCYLRIARS